MVDRTRLKTLKDIKNDYNDWYDRTTVDYVLDNIQKYAREWYKEARIGDCPGVSWEEHNIDNAFAFNEGIEWFCKHFFNLEDEDEMS